LLKSYLNAKQSFRGNRQQHDQIPDLYAFFELNVPGLQPGKQDRFYLVQEFIDGKNLEEELAERQVPRSSVASAGNPQGAEVCTRMALSTGIKPSNIMRHRNGKLYLLDFGAVKQVTKAAVGAGSSTGIYGIRTS